VAGVLVSSCSKLLHEHLAFSLSNDPKAPSGFAGFASGITQEVNIANGSKNVALRFKIPEFIAGFLLPKRDQSVLSKLEKEKGFIWENDLDSRIGLFVFGNLRKTPIGVGNEDVLFSQKIDSCGSLPSVDGDYIEPLCEVPRFFNLYRNPRSLRIDKRLNIEAGGLGGFFGSLRLAYQDAKRSYTNAHTADANEYEYEASNPSPL
jgi:hypothetical protein